ncbi:MAG: hypothetical protein LBB38_01155 [Puniceicoccales bacterium]|nr:hypothetical protein [Puniceicoccales bacterium]
MTIPPETVTLASASHFPPENDAKEQSPTILLFLCKTVAILYILLFIPIAALSALFDAVTIFKFSAMRRLPGIFTWLWNGGKIKHAAATSPPADIKPNHVGDEQVVAVQENSSTDPSIEATSETDAAAVSLAASPAAQAASQTHPATIPPAPDDSDEITDPPPDQLPPIYVPPIFANLPDGKCELVPGSLTKYGVFEHCGAEYESFTVAIRAVGADESAESTSVDVFVRSSDGDAFFNLVGAETQTHGAVATRHTDESKCDPYLGWCFPVECVEGKRPLEIWMRPSDDVLETMYLHFDHTILAEPIFEALPCGSDTMAIAAPYISGGFSSVLFASPQNPNKKDELMAMLTEIGNGSAVESCRKIGGDGLYELVLGEKAIVAHMWFSEDDFVAPSRESFAAFFDRGSYAVEKCEVCGGNLWAGMWLRVTFAGGISILMQPCDAKLIGVLHDVTLKKETVAVGRNAERFRGLSSRSLKYRESDGEDESEPSEIEVYILTNGNDLPPLNDIFDASEYKPSTLCPSQNDWRTENGTTYALASLKFTKLGDDELHIDVDIVVATDDDSTNQFEAIVDGGNYTIDGLELAPDGGEITIGDGAYAKYLMRYTKDDQQKSMEIFVWTYPV